MTKNPNWALGGLGENCMSDDITQTIRENYDRLAGEYARKLFDELQNKPIDREGDMATIRDKVGHLETLPIDLLLRASRCVFHFPSLGD
jgi:hypothetical protein